MKQLKTIIVSAVMLITITNLKAQNKIDNKKTKEYQLNNEFTGEITTNLDSTFVMYCVFNEKDLKNINKIKIKTGKNSDTLIADELLLNDKKRIMKKDKTIWVEIGKIDENKQEIEIYTTDFNGVCEKSNLKTK